MTPREKARHLIEKYNLIVLDTALGGSNTRVKKCALFAVDEIINDRQKDCSLDENFEIRNNSNMFITYWNEVKKELEKL